LIKGPEGLLVDRALDQLRALAYEADPNLERTDINAATYQAGQLDVIASPSLFGESRMVIIRDLETMSDALANDLIAYAGACRLAAAKAAGPEAASLAGIDTQPLRFDVRPRWPLEELPAVSARPPAAAGI